MRRWLRVIGWKRKWRELGGSQKLIERFVGVVNGGSDMIFSVDTAVIARSEIDDRCFGSSILHCFMGTGARDSEGRHVAARMWWRGRIFHGKWGGGKSRKKFFDRNKF